MKLNIIIILFCFVILNIISFEKINVSVIGDIMAHIDLQESAINNRLGYEYLFKNIKKYFINKDLVIGNLETPLSDSLPISGYPLFSSNSQYLKAIKDSNINFLSTANNHSFDKKKHGVISTVNILRNNNINFAGTGLSLKDSDKFIIKRINNISIALYSLTFSLNGLLNEVEKNDNFYINYYSQTNFEYFNNLLERVNEIKKLVDKVIILYHIGDEYSKLPNNDQIERFYKLINKGADIIIGCHPHVLQELNYHSNINENNILYIYSIGNFISAQTRYNLIENYLKDYSNLEVRTSETIILNFELLKFNKNVYIVNPNYIPLFNIVKNENNGFYSFNLYSFDDINNDNVDNIEKKYLEKIKKIITIRDDEIKKIIKIPRY